MAFYIQAGLKPGFGHLQRSAAVAKALEALGFKLHFILATDESGEIRAQQLGMQSQIGLPNNAVIIDAATIPEHDMKFLLSFQHRILISPVCDKIEMMTLILTRSKFIESTSNDKLQIPIIENSDFFFTTTNSLQKRSLDFGKISVGICLSGGTLAFSAQDLVCTLAENTSVAAIYLLDRQEIEVRTAVRMKVHQIAFSRAPWDFLSEINVFVGGDGLLISEAVAQGIPSFSLTSSINMFKNKHLEELRCVKSILWDDLDYGNLQGLVTDRESVSQMHQLAMQVNYPDGAKVMAVTIQKALGLGGAEIDSFHR